MITSIMKSGLLFMASIVLSRISSAVSWTMGALGMLLELKIPAWEPANYKACCLLALTYSMPFMMMLESSST